MEPQPAGCWRADILSQLKQRNRSEVAPFQALLLLQSRLMEQSAHLQTENATLTRLNQSLKEEKVQLEAALQARAAVNQVADSHTIHELQMKMFNLQEELTELHRCGDGFRVVSVAFSHSVADPDPYVFGPPGSVRGTEPEPDLIKQK